MDFVFGSCKLGGGHHRRRVRDRSYWCSDILGVDLPGVAVSVRRLHDLDCTGWWLLIAFTGIGIILLIVWNCMKGTTGSNSFGADPLAA